MDTGNTILLHSIGTAARSTRIDSSSPSPEPSRLSPVCLTEPSGLSRLLKNTKYESEIILPDAFSRSALASRSNPPPVVDRSSQPRPIIATRRFGACLVSETFPPLLRLTDMPSSKHYVHQLTSVMRSGQPRKCEPRHERRAAGAVQARGGRRHSRIVVRRIRRPS